MLTALLAALAIATGATGPDVPPDSAPRPPAVSADRASAPPLGVDSLALSIEGAEVLAPRLARLRGMPADSAGIAAVADEAVEAANREGFLLASIEILFFDPAAGILAMRARSGPRFVWNLARKEGSSRMRPEVLRRYAGLRLGAPASPEDLERAAERLEMTGYVSHAQPPRLALVPRTQSVEAVFTLSDVPSSRIEAAGAWSQESDAQGFLEADLRDILGTARDLSLHIGVDQTATYVRSSYREPWIGPLDIGLELRGELAIDSLSRLARGSADFLWNASPRSLWRAGFEASDQSTTGSADSGRSTSLGSRFGWEYATRVFGPWPRSGFRSDLLGTFSTERAADSSRFRIRGELALEGFVSISRIAVARLAASGRGFWPLDPSLPGTEAAPLGGTTSWRGYREGNFRAHSWVFGTAELRLGRPRVGGLLGFVEPGFRWRRREDREFEPVAQASAGAGFLLVRGAWEVSAIYAANDRTPNWEDALLHVRAISRF